MLKRKLVAALCFAFVLWNGAAHAQAAQVVNACGAQNLPLTPIFNSGLFMDHTGNLCTNASGSGGGGLSVVFGGAIGANGTPIGFKDASGNFQPLIGNTAALGPYVDTATTSYLATLINNPPNVGVNGTNTALTGATPGGSRTGTIVGMDVNVASVGQQALVPDPCMTNAKLPFNLTQTSSTNFITGTAGKKNYICSVKLLASGSNTNVLNLSLVEFSGACTGGTANVIDGSSTAANGPGYTAGGGFVAMGGGAVAYSGVGNANTGYNVCLLQNGTGSATISGLYVQQ